jgi:hypothetical protein
MGRHAVADAVLAEVADGIGIITINRPEARNAVNEAVARASRRPLTATPVATSPRHPHRARAAFCAGWTSGVPGRENSLAGGLISVDHAPALGQAGHRRGGGIRASAG